MQEIVRAAHVSINDGTCKGLRILMTTHLEGRQLGQSFTFEVVGKTSLIKFKGTSPEDLPISPQASSRIKVARHKFRECGGIRY